MHFFHNDTDNDAEYSYLPEMGVDAFNFTYRRDIAAVRRATGEMCLMGNVSPLSLADKTPDLVYRQVREVIEAYLAENGDCRGLLLSAGGGLPMGAKKENIDAVVRCAEDFNRKAGIQRAADSGASDGKT